MDQREKRLNLSGPNSGARTGSAPDDIITGATGQAAA